ncbi:DUF2809 domain-containing protein [Nonomuraea sp. NPDC005983]|uniref:ribosomal maturation YjgA family protein n=1 Tax=Nonomuraea sp. NPDC005983 TaxID=3155595 RepID=UPI0033B8D442
MYADASRAVKRDLLVVAGPSPVPLPVSLPRAATVGGVSRLPVLVAAALTVVAGLGVRALWDGPVAKYAGDALYTVLIYALIVLAWRHVRPMVAALLAAGLSWAIEFAQLGEVPTVLRPLLGSTFNPPDLFWYAVGAAAAWALHARFRPARPHS